MTRIRLWGSHFLSFHERSFLLCVLLPSCPAGSTHSLLVTQVKVRVYDASVYSELLLHLKGN